MKKIFKSKVFKWSIGIFLLLIFLFFHFYAPKLIVDRRHSDKQYPKPSDFDIQTEVIHIQSKDGLKLEGLFCASNTDSIAGTVIFIHGIGGKKEHFLPMAYEIAQHGFQSLLIDLRTHGNSEGDYITYGFYETQDISDFITLVSSQKELGKLGIWGQSLGGAISLQMLAKDKRIEFGIIESTYCTFDEVIHDYAKRMFGISFGYLTDYVIWRAQSVGSFEKTNINPEESCKNITQPVLYVHGTADDRIDVAYGKRNFEAIASSDKELVLVEGANHVNVWETGGEAYLNRCITFLKSK